MAGTIESKSTNSSLPLIRDPNFAKNRIFVGNLPICTREELESICIPYGKVLASLVQKNFGFVQFESEEIATKVSNALTKSSFKGNIITVRNAGAKQPAPKVHANGANSNLLNKQVPDNNNSATNSDYNDCEIIVVDRRNTKYAERIEDRLKRLNIRVDVLFPNEDVPLGKVLANISSRGCLYAILITNQHEEHNSITVNILYGQPAEHRNMPVEDAINLITGDFQSKISRDTAQETIGGLNSVSTVNMSKPVSMLQSVTGMVPPSIKDRHPDGIKMLADMLSNNQPLTVLQYDCIIKYLRERRELQLKAELGDATYMASTTPDPEIQLQKKILNILNKPSVAETQVELLYPTVFSVKDDIRMMEMLQDFRVQRALDSLMDSNLVGTIQKYMKF